MRVAGQVLRVLLVGLIVSCSPPPQRGSTSASAPSATTLTAPVAAPAPDALPNAEADIKRTVRERAGLAKLGPGAVEFSSYLDRTASFLLTTLPGKLHATSTAGRLIAPRSDLPPQGATIIGVYAMTVVVFEGLISDAPLSIKDSNADNRGVTEKTADPQSTTDEVTVEGNKGKITTTIRARASLYLSRISVEIKLEQEGEVRDAKTGAVLYKISSGAVGTASGDFCPDSNGQASATFSFIGREGHFDSTGANIGNSDTSFGGELRFKVSDAAKLTTIDIIPNGALGGALMGSIAQGTAGPYEKGWRSGVCIQVLVDPDGGEVDPGAKKTVTVKLRQRVEGKDLDKDVEATMTGGVKSLEPSGQKQKPPATYTYTAGSEPGDKGTLSFDTTSNRGIGHTSVEFNVAGGWIVNGTGTSNESFQGGVTTGAFRVAIKDLKITAGKDNALKGEGTMTITGPATSGQGICRGQLDQTLPITARGTVVGSGTTAVLKVTLVTASPPGIEVTYTCTFPGTGFTTTQTIGAQGFADRFGEALGEIELPAEGGTRSLGRTRDIGSGMVVTAAGTLTIARAKK